MRENEIKFLNTYFAKYRAHAFGEHVFPLITKFADLAREIRAAGRKMIFGGNGASASTAEHGAVDFTKQGGVRAITLHSANLLTCFANDYGYDDWLKYGIEHYGDDGDAVVMISVSGESPSVVKALEYARQRNMPTIAFTGRNPDNSLGRLADIHFHVPLDDYNIVENIHGIWLCAAIDLLIGKSVYETRKVDIHSNSSRRAD